MNLFRLAILLIPVLSAWGQPFWDYMLHPERLSWPLDAEIHHFSSWARNGSNSDLGHYYGADSFGNQILCDIDGPGVVTDMWWTQDNQTSAWRWRLYVDNTTTALIDTPLVCPFGQMSPFLPPVADSSSGAYYSYTPIPFQNHLRITYNDVRDIYFHVTVMKFPPGTQIESFTMPPSADYMTHLDSLANRLSAPATPIYVPIHGSSNFSTVLAAGQKVVAYDGDLSGQTRRIMLALQNRTQSVFENFWIRVFTDGYPVPDIEGPVSVAMGTPIGWRPYQSTVTGSVGDTLYFNQPVVAYRGLKIEFENKTSVPQPFSSRVEIADGEVGPLRLNGQYHEGKPTRLWESYLIGEFSGAGNFVGTVQDMQQDDNHVLEGDETIFIDGETIPSWHGTGTEDYYKGGWYWTPDYEQLPLHGCVVYLGDSAAAYRWHNNDPVPFKSHLKFDIEVGRFNNLSGHYRTMAFAYVERPKWQAIDANHDQATHAGELIRIVGRSLDPLSPVYGAQLGDSWLDLADGALLAVNGDSVFDVTFQAPDTLAHGEYPLLILTESGFDTIYSAWLYHGVPTLWFQSKRTDATNAVYAGDTLRIELRGLQSNEPSTIAIDGIPCPWLGLPPLADGDGYTSGEVRVPLGLSAGDYLVTCTPKASAHGVADSLLHYRHWFRLEPEVLHHYGFSGARIKEEWCRDWTLSTNTDPWGRGAAYVLTGNSTSSYVNLPFYAPTGGTFQTAFFFAKTSNAAIVTVQINGQNCLTNYDTYQNTMYQSWVRTDTLWGGVQTINPGYNMLTVRTVGLNPLSSGWKAILDQVLFIGTQPEPAPNVVEHVRIIPAFGGVRLYWSPVELDVEGNSLTPFAYDIFSSFPEDTMWVWQAETPGSDTTWVTEFMNGNSIEFMVTARRGDVVPLSTIPKQTTNSNW